LYYLPFAQSLSLEATVQYGIDQDVLCAHRGHSPLLLPLYGFWKVPPQESPVVFSVYLQSDQRLVVECVVN
jgi:hypothetical protein